MGFELFLPSGVAVPVGEAPTGVGRGPMNGVVLADDSVSWQHAVVWVEGGRAWVRDLGSRNGTFVNGQRATTSTRLGDGDEVRIGAHAVLNLRGAGRAEWRTRQVEDIGSGLRVAVRGDRFVLGSGAGADLRVGEWPARAATLVFHANGEIWVGTDADEFPIEPGAPFDVAGRSLRVVEDIGEHAATVDASPQGYPYVLTIDASVPTAVLFDPVAARELQLAGNRAVLLFALARQLVRDREAGVASSEQGWCRTDEVLTAIWGRLAKDANPLNVLVHRLRGHLVEEGFDPWFVEKRRGAIRLGLRDVVVHTPGQAADKPRTEE